MRGFIIALILISAFACSNKKSKATLPFSGKELLTVANGGSINDFNELTKKTKFYLVDSLSGKIDGVQFVGYVTRDTSKSPNILEVHSSNDSEVIFLSFKTDNKDNFLQLKEDFIKEGFKVYKKSHGIEGLQKKNNPIDIIMMGDEKNSNSFKIFMGKNYK